MEPLESIMDEMFSTRSDCDTEKPKNQSHCGICGEHHSIRDCAILKVTGHVSDKPIPPKARLTLPDFLEIRKLCDGTHSVYTKSLIKEGTRFGPFQARKLFTLHPSIDFPLKLFTNVDEDLSEYFLDTTDENECSWLIFVSPASNVEEQNVICYQDGEHLYYATLRDIYPGEPLKVWYSPYYALKMRKSTLRSVFVEDNIPEKKSVDLEAILRKKKNISPRESWSCKFCGKVEKELSVFALHMLTHYRIQASRVCPLCKDYFQHRRVLKKHLKTVHANDLAQSTEKIEESKIMAITKKEHESKDTVGGPLLLTNVTADSLDNSSILLPQTDLMHLDLNGIENQNMMMESENLNLNVDNIINDNVKQLDHFNFDLNDSEPEQFICDICLKSFTKLKTLIPHMEQHTGKFLCHKCNKIFTRNENLIHHSCNVYYKIKCPLCDKIFSQQKFLTLHMKGVHEKKFTCEKCSKFYDSKSSLETHVCPGVPPHKKVKFPCSICGKIFFNKKNLYEHLGRHRKTHPSNKKINCELCNAELGSRKSYLKHVKAHSGSYSCDVCCKIFTRLDTLKEHKTNVHRTDEQPATCAICNKTLASRKQLKRHLEIHCPERPHKCDVCPASFKQRSNLTKHKRTHKSVESKLESLFKENTEVFSCPECDRNFKLKSSLIRHMRSMHLDYELSNDILKPKQARLSMKRKRSGMSEEDERIMDLKETIDNMNFSTDDVNNCSENSDINIEIDNILNNTDNLEKYLTDNSGPMEENLISIAASDDQVGGLGNEFSAKEVCLSMPELNEDQEIELSDTAFILDNGNIVEPQENSSKVVVYILNQDNLH